VRDQLLKAQVMVNPNAEAEAPQMDKKILKKKGRGGWA